MSVMYQMKPVLSIRFLVLSLSELAVVLVLSFSIYWNGLSILRVYMK